MAKVFELDEAAWQEWVDSRPAVVKGIAERLRPDKLYRMKSTRQRVTMHSINENGTVTVDVTGRFNLIDFDRQVFGIDPDDLEECDLPTAGESVGTLCNEEEADALIASRIAMLHREGKQHNEALCPVCHPPQ
jgi:hypothetical protein